MNTRQINRLAFISDVIKFVYNTAIDKSISELNRLIKENSNLYGNKSPYLRYKGEVYFIEGVNSYIGQPSNPLHKDLRTPFKKWLGDKAAMRLEIEYIKAYLLRAVSFTYTKNELIYVLPNALEPIIKKTFIASIASSRTTEELEQFMIENKEFENKIRERLVINLLES
jgi:hypothetical protein